METLKFKNLSQLKGNLRLDSIIKIKNLLKDNEKEGIITAVKTNSIAYKRKIEKEDLDYYRTYYKHWITKEEDNFFITSFLYFQPTKHMKFLEDGTIQFLAYTDKRNILLPTLDFKEGEVWLEMKLFKGE